MALYRFFQRKEQPVVPTLSMCGASSLRANNNVSRVLCPGDSESAKLTPRAHYNDYTAKERAEIGKYPAEDRESMVMRYEIRQNLKLPNYIRSRSDRFAKLNGSQNFPLYGSTEEIRK